MQANLLRVLQEREMKRIGSQPIPLDIRVVAATNRDIEQAAAQGAFRQDLYFRLKVVSIKAPWLRDRVEDIPVLAGYFVERYRREFGKPVSGISAEAIAMLQRYEWAGNVRELQNEIERAC